MAGGSVKLSIYSTFKDDGTKKAERAINSFVKKYGELDKATGKKTVSDATRQLAEQSMQLDMAAAKWQGYADKLQAAGEALTKYVSAPATAAIVASTKLASDYEDSFAKVKTIMDKTALAPEELSKQVLQLSVDTGRAAGELAEATYQALSAGVATESAAGFVANAVNLAKTGFTDTSSAVDALTTVINAYKLSADDALSISDKLIQTQNDGKTTVNELASSLGSIIPTASALNVNLDNVMTSYAIMTKQGIRTADATTALRSTLSELSNEGSTVAGILRERTGKSFGELMADGQSLGDVLGVLYDSVDGNGEAFKNLWGNVRAGTGALALANAGAEGFSDELARMQGASGNVAAALEDLDTSSAKANRAINAIKNTGIELGQEFLGALAPGLQAAADAAQGVYTAFSEMDEGQKQAIAGALAFTAALGPMTFAASKVAGGVSSMLSGMGKVSAKLAEFSAKGIISARTATALSTALSGPVVAAAAAAAVAIGALVAVYLNAKKRSDELANATGGLNAAVRAGSPSVEKATADMSSYRAELGHTVVGVTDLIEAQSKMVDGINKRNESAQAEISQLEGARAVIEKYMNQTNLTAQQQGELRAAIDRVNEACGAQYQVVDATNGVVADEAGNVLEAADAIWEYIRAKEQQIRVEALEQDLADVQAQKRDDTLALVEATRQLEAAEKAVAELPADTSAGERAQAVDQLEDMRDKVNELQAAFEATDDAEQQLMTQLGNIAASGDEATRSLETLAGASDAFAWMDEVQLSAFAGQLESLGVTTEQFASLSDAQLIQLSSSWDGSAASIIAAAQRIGIEVPEGMDATSEAAAAGESTGQAYADGLGEAEGPTRGAASAISSAAAGMKVDGTWGWGYDAGANFASGLSAASSVVETAASGIASIAAAILGHSIAKKGPLHNRGKGEAEWGAHAIENFASGMNRGVRLVEMASGAAAQAAADGLQSRGASSPRPAAGELRISTADIRLLSAAIGREAKAAGGTVNNYNTTLNYKAGDDVNEMVRDLGFALRTSAMMEG